jgi:DNA modification methylase
VTTGPQDDAGLFDAAAYRVGASTLLRERFLEPPFTVLNRRGSDWLDRDRKWKDTGIQSELGRDGKLNFQPPQVTYRNWYDVKNLADDASGRKLTDAELLESEWAVDLVMYRPEGVQTSVFSPTLCELVYRWYSAPGHRVLDPFAGGSVRGVVAGAMGRDYLGVELRPEQVASNREQAHLAGDVTPRWVQGDSARLADVVGPDYEADLVFTCPPYAHLEVYSDDPADMSNMDYPQFLDAYRAAIAQAVQVLRRDRFICWVVGEVRQKGGGPLVGLVPDTVQAFRDAGASYYNDHILLTPIGTAANRAPRAFNATRKPPRVHEYLLVFVKGDGKAAAQAAGDAEVLGER